MAESCTSGDPYKIAAFMKAAENLKPAWNVLVVSQRGVFYIGEDFDVHKMKSGYMSIGAAGQVALGALAVAKRVGEEPGSAVKLAVTAAVEHHLFAVGPVKVKVLP